MGGAAATLLRVACPWQLREWVALPQLHRPPAAHGVDGSDWLDSVALRSPLELLHEGAPHSRAAPPSRAPPSRAAPHSRAASHSRTPRRPPARRAALPRRAAPQATWVPTPTTPCHSCLSRPSRPPGGWWPVLLTGRQAAGGIPGQATTACAPPPPAPRTAPVRRTSRAAGSDSPPPRWRVRGSVLSRDHRLPRRAAGHRVLPAPGLVRAVL